jgi:predicted DNA-binding helix-hairpin-helix protein
MSLDIDPKLAWALQHRHLFPVDVNTASREMLVRVPGLGVKTAIRLIQARRHRRMRMDDLARLRLSVSKLMPFVIAADHHPGATLDSATLAASLVQKPTQLQLF